MGLNETITVINKSNKVVSSSKHIVAVFKDAKSAYLQRKAEIAAERNAAAKEKKKLSDGMKALRLDNDDTQSRASSRHSRHSKHRSRTDPSLRPSPMERGYSDPFHANDATTSRHTRHRFEDDLAGSAHEGHRRELVRRHTEMDVNHASHRMARAHTERHIDMDLAYGDVPPPLPLALATPNYDEEELQAQASKLQTLLDEANCVQHTVTAMVENLQKNPDALAAVALTLAEISAIVKTMGPGVLTMLKGSFPAVVALLASPQFMIAAGVGVGVTIVALGGYKIIRKLQTQKVAEEPIPMGPMGVPMAEVSPEEPYQLDELETKELSRIEMWRRGIAEVEADSQGTIVDGEFVTPGATRHLVAAGVLDEDDIKSRRNSKMKEDKEHRTKSHRTKSVKSAKTSASRSKTSSKEKEKEKESSKPKKKKEPSVLRSIFAH